MTQSQESILSQSWTSKASLLPRLTVDTTSLSVLETTSERRSLRLPITCPVSQKLSKFLLVTVMNSVKSEPQRKKRAPTMIHQRKGQHQPGHTPRRPMESMLTNQVICYPYRRDNNATLQRRVTTALVHHPQTILEQALLKEAQVLVQFQTTVRQVAIHLTNGPNKRETWTISLKSMATTSAQVCLRSRTMVNCLTMRSQCRSWPHNPMRKIADLWLSKKHRVALKARQLNRRCWQESHRQVMVIMSLDANHPWAVRLTCLRL